MPAPLVALVLGTVAVLFLLPDAPVLGEIPTDWPAPRLPVLTLEAVPGIVQSALVLALLGSIDSLLTSLIADNVTQTYHDSDRELIGQGIGNTLASAFGGIPGAGATMRTVINVRTGGRTPISGALHALVLLAVVLGLGGLAQHIPHAVLAGILIKVGIDIIDWPYLKRIRQAPRAGVFFMLVVLLLTVLVDLITAVAVGIVLASLLFVKRMSDLQLANIKAITGGDDEPGLTEAEISALAAGDGRIILYHLSGPFSFGAAKGMARLLAASDDYDALVLDLSDVPFLDSSASLVLDSSASLVLEAAIIRGTDFIEQGCVGHNQLWFYRLAIDACLRLEDWNEAEKFADKLDTFTAGEAMPWSRFFCARARGLAMWGRNDRSTAIRQTLEELSVEAHELGFNAAVLAIDAALQSES